MKTILALTICACLGSQAFAGVSVGGSSGLTVGKTSIMSSEIRMIGEDHFELDKPRMMDVIAGSMAHEPMQLNGEPMAAEGFDFVTRALSLRSLSNPEHVIVIQEVADDTGE